ncbi:MAG: DUF58 domain-containing protein [Lentisphaeria bacterium]|nr:DUF58 domain-containing protein [Lentisphaeria bacterium]
MTSDPVLFPPELLAAAGMFRVTPAKGGAPFSSGRHRSPRRGESAEFQDFRSYAPGDDLRRVDWNIYRRFHRLLIRQYRDFPRMKHLVILDDTASIRCRPARAFLAWRLALLICGTLLANGDCTALQIGEKGRRRIFAPGSVPSAPLVAELLESFGRKTPGDALSFGIPPGVRAWVISDFMDPRGLDHLEMCLRRSRGFTPVRVFEQSEIHPEPAAEMRLIDAESGAEVTVSPGQFRLASYRERLARFERLLAIPARRAGSRVHAFDAALGAPELLRQCADTLFQGGGTK